MSDIKKISIIGMGALGLLYADHIARNYGESTVDFVMDEARYQKYRDSQFKINGRDVSFQMTSSANATPADLVIVAVKYNGLQSAFDVMRPCIGPNTIVISVMNGISSEKMIAEQFPGVLIVYTVAQGMDAMKFGNALNFTQMGKLHVGARAGEDTTALDALVDFFEEISMPYVKEEDIMYRLWFKFMLNVGINQVCMVYDTTYSGATDPEGEPYRTLISAMREVRSLAEDEGVMLTEADINTCVEIERTLDPNGTPSMGQDRINRKPCEVDMFAGTVIALANKYGVRVPVNEFLYKRAKEIESEYVN